MKIQYVFQGREKTFERSSAELTIGRNDKLKGVQVDLDLSPDQSVSRRHACMIEENGQFWIEDSGSKHGTYINEKDIRGKGRVPIGPEDEIRFGNETTARLLVEKKEEPREPPPGLPPLKVSVECLPEVNYSLVHADVPFLKKVVVHNIGVEPLENAELQLELSVFASSLPVQLPDISPGASITVDPLPRFIFRREALRALASPEKVAIEAWIKGAPIPLEEQPEVTLLSPGAWYASGHEHALAGFVMPLSGAAKEIRQRARFELRRLVRGVQGWADMEESDDPRAAEKTLKALYFCLQERYEIVYEYEPHTCAPHWQVVRFPDEVLNEHQGTCIDLCLLMAACLENVGRDPLIIIVRTGYTSDGYEIRHALIGCWRDGSPRGATLIRDEDALRRWVDNGEMLVIDSMGFPETKKYPSGMSFSQSRKQGRKYINDCALVYALDIVAAREAGLHPMPFGTGLQFDKPASHALYRARREAEELHSQALTARHLLVGLLSLKNGLLERTLESLQNGSAERVREIARESMTPRTPHRGRLRESDHWKRIMRRLEQKAKEGEGFLITEAMLSETLLETPSQVGRVLKEAGLSHMQCLAKLREMLNGEIPLSVWSSSGFRE